MNAIVPADNTSATPLPPAFGWLQQWRGEKFDQLEPAAEYLRNRTRQSRSTVVENRAISLVANDHPETLDDLNALTLQVEGVSLGFTHWSFGQLAALAKAPASYLRSLPGPIVRDCIEYSLRYQREVEQVMPYFDDTGLRAVTGPKYGRVDDADVLDAVQSAIDTGRWLPAEGHMGISATDRSLQVFLVDQQDAVEIGRAPNGGADTLRRGLRITNSEVGYGALRVDAFLFRDYCTNGCIFGLQGSETISIRHSANAPHRWIREVQPALVEYLEGDANNLLSRVEKAQEARIAADNDAAVEWMRSRGMSARMGRRALELHEAEEGRPVRSGWDMIQAITAVAREQTAVETRVELESLGGKVLDLVAA